MKLSEIPNFLNQEIPTTTYLPTPGFEPITHRDLLIGTQHRQANPLSH